MKDDLYCLVDIGGTKILLIVMDEAENIIFREKRATPKPEEPEAVINVIKELLAEANKKYGYRPEKKPKAIGVCIAGFLDHRKGLVYQSPNLHWDEPVHFAQIMSQQLDCPVFIENDANAAVVGEVFYGAAKGHRNAVYVTISTGIGGGLFLDGRLYRGHSGFAGEIGHIKPFGKGRTCNCGGHDCFERWASGTGIKLSAKTLWSENEISPDSLNAKWIFEQAEKGNTLAKNIVDYTMEITGTGLANLVNLFNPSCIVIGGGVAANSIKYCSGITKVIKREAIRPSVDITPLEIVPSHLEPDAGLWGMYALLTGQLEE
ncbi:MAG: ROK family protein [Bacillota bacterium]